MHLISTLGAILGDPKMGSRKYSMLLHQWEYISGFLFTICNKKMRGSNMCL